MTLHPSRIGCPSLPGTMKGMMLSLKGVRAAAVRYEDRSVDVTFNDEETSADEIIKMIGREMGLALERGAPGASKEGGAAETCPM